MSETDFLKLKKHDNVETNTEKFDIDNYLNGNWDKINENAKKVNTDISNINSKNKEQDTNIGQLQENTETSSNKIAELEKELKEAQEDFYQNSIRGQASGEYIHVEDSSNCRAKIKISGNSEQETRSGKNKIEITKTTTTVNGCTHTIKDGTDTLSGTSSTNWANLIIYSFVGDGKTYTLSGSPSTSKNIFISAHDNVQKKDLATSKNGSTGTFVATNGNSIDIIICVAPNLTLANELFKPQLEEGLKATVWEQGGASPSTDHQSEVESVGSNINIFDKDNPDMFLNRLTPDNAGNIVSTLTDTTKTNYIITIIVPCKGNKQYTISRWLSGKTFIVYESEKNKFNINDKVTLLKRNDNSGIINETIATSANAKYILVKIYSTWGNEENTYNDLISSIKIEKGKVATSYSKYGQGCVKVTKCNKNLLPALKSQSKENKGIIFSYNAETQEFNVKGTTTDTTFYTILTFEELKYLSKDKKYILSISNLMPTKCMVTLTKINVINNGIIHEGEKQTTVDNLDKYKPDGFMFYGQNLEKGTKIDFTFKAQIEESTKATEYEQHEEQSYIMPVQKEMLQGDYFDFDNEEEVHTWGKKILDGTENWAYEKLTSADGEKNNFYLKIDDAMSNGKVYSNAFVQRSTLADNYSMFMSSGKNLNLRYQEKSSSTDFKAYLKSQYDAGTPVVVYYKLATFKRLKFKDEQKAVAKELNNARTYKNVTNITTDSKAILSLDYAKDLETLLTSKESEV